MRNNKTAPTRGNLSRPIINGRKPITNRDMITPYTPPNQGQSDSLTVFQNTSLGISVRSMLINGEPWFVAKDVCDALGYGNNRDALSKHVRHKWKNTVAIRDGILGNPYRTIISEPGLYSLILKANTPNAEQFQDWVCEDVLPSIRKTGGYMVARQGETEDELNARIEAIVQEAVRKRDEQLRDLERKVIRYAPVVLYLNAVSPTSALIEMGVLANLIDKAGKNMGRTRLFNLLREMGYVCRVKGRYNLPTQKAVNAGVLSLSEEHGRNRKTMVTPRGKVFFTNLFLSGDQLDFLAGLRVAV